MTDEPEVTERDKVYHALKSKLTWSEQNQPGMLTVAIDKDLLLLATLWLRPRKRSPRSSVEPQQPETSE